MTLNRTEYKHTCAKHHQVSWFTCCVFGIVISVTVHVNVLYVVLGLSMHRRRKKVVFFWCKINCSIELFKKNCLYSVFIFICFTRWAKPVFRRLYTVRNKLLWILRTLADLACWKSVIILYCSLYSWRQW